MPPLEVAQAQYLERQRLVQATAAAGVQMWQQVDPANLTASWLPWLGRLLTILRGAQYVAASSADTYTDSVLHAQGIQVPAAGKVSANALAGIASDGRPLETLLLNPVIATKTAILHGADVPRAMATGQATLEMTLRTQVADAGRVADGVATTARPKTGYVRLLVGDSCPRCVILAGRFYRYSDGFERHPQCDCIHVPARAEEAAKSEGLINDPRAYFDSLSESEQDKKFGSDDAKAIRDGADMNQVVNARRGMSTAGRTTEGSSRRGIAGQRLRGATRLMPEAIYQQSTGREDAVRLLRMHGYIV